MPYNEKYYYLKLKNDFFKKSEIIILRSLENGDTYLILYQQLLLSGSYFNRNYRYLDISPVFEEPIEFISIMFDYSIEFTKKAFEILLEYGFIEFSNKIIIVKDFNKDFNSNRDRTTPKYKTWRENVFVRDKYTCTICKKSGVKLNAHHVLSWKNYPEHRFDIDNGITVCVPCHIDIHRKEGKK